MTPEAIAHQYNLKRRGNRWAGPCPQCGGSPTSDKFVLRDDGGFKCYACDFRGDAITWHREMLGMSCPEAHEAVGKACDHLGCSVRSTCRLGDGSGPRRRPQPQSVKPLADDKSRTVRTAEAVDPADTWRQWAYRFMVKAAERLADEPAALQYLAARGVDRQAAVKARLGWNHHTRRVNRASIGLSPERAGKTTLWIPEGIVIPNIVGGRIHSLNIRRTDADLQRFLPERRYQFIEGGTRAPMLLCPDPVEGLPVLIVEAELDAIACAAACSEVAVVALATVQGNLTPRIEDLCRRAPIILVALDADPESAAGQKAVANWRTTWAHARYWPVPSGKDPGNYAEAGGCLATWIRAGLPALSKVNVPALSKPNVPPRPVASAPQSTGHAEEPIRLDEPAGGEGRTKEILPEHVTGTSGGGTPYVVANRREDVAILRRHYARPVFHLGELRQLKGVDKDGAELALVIKDIFDNAEIIGSRLME